MMGWYGGGGGFVLMTLLMLVFWGLLIFGGLAVYRSMRGGDVSRQTGRGDAERLLDERFARGEIDSDEYTRRRELLRSGR